MHTALRTILGNLNSVHRYNEGTAVIIQEQLQIYFNEVNTTKYHFSINAI